MLSVMPRSSFGTPGTHVTCISSSLRLCSAVERASEFERKEIIGEIGNSVKMVGTRDGSALRLVTLVSGSVRRLGSSNRLEIKRGRERTCDVDAST